MGICWFGSVEAQRNLKPIEITITTNTPSPEAVTRFAKTVQTIAQNHVDQKRKQPA